MPTSENLASSLQAPSISNAICLKLGAFLVLLLALFGSFYLIRPTAMMTEAGVVMKWPDRVFDFTGKDEGPNESETAILPPDTEFAKKTYTAPNGEHINVEIVLSGVEHRSIHRPEICLWGQGWNVRSGKIVKVPLKSGRNLDVMVLDITRPWRTPSGATVEVPALYSYFFVSKDAETAKHIDRIAITNLDLLFRNKAHRWAYVIVMARVMKGFTPDGKDRDQTLKMIEDFLRETAPTFLKSELPAKPAA
ncbi:MAG TPA: exosortase-associated EpsI family protein [Chthoniobacterales bacterium]|nr:exosortase-associated EpsI family protein [Chthoniobacterales bacterium]